MYLKALILTYLPPPPPPVEVIVVNPAPDIEELELPLPTLLHQLISSTTIPNCNCVINAPPVLETVSVEVLYPPAPPPPPLLISTTSIRLQLYD
jgi:hypothetical protein